MLRAQGITAISSLRQPCREAQRPMSMSTMSAANNPVGMHAISCSSYGYCGAQFACPCYRSDLGMHRGTHACSIRDLFAGPMLGSALVQ